MKNETIETYTKITIEEAAQLQRDGWKNFVLGHIGWGIYNLDAIAHCGCPNPFYSDESNSWYPQCAKVTELDPCVAPDGCPELEPWMAYVGTEPLNWIVPVGEWQKGLYGVNWEAGWQDNHGGCNKVHRAIDVRTAWAQEHFPEHCRIRNHQEPDVFEEFCEAWALDSMQYASPKWFKGMMKQAYELGQANPQTK